MKRHRGWRKPAPSANQNSTFQVPLRTPFSFPKSEKMGSPLGSPNPLKSSEVRTSPPSGASREGPGGDFLLKVVIVTKHQNSRCFRNIWPASGPQELPFPRLWTPKPSKGRSNVFFGPFREAPEISCFFGVTSAPK